MVSVLTKHRNYHDIQDEILIFVVSFRFKDSNSVSYIETFTFALFRLTACNVASAIFCMRLPLLYWLFSTENQQFYLRQIVWEWLAKHFSSDGGINHYLQRSTVSTYNLNKQVINYRRKMSVDDLFTQQEFQFNLVTKNQNLNPEFFIFQLRTPGKYYC